MLETEATSASQLMRLLCGTEEFGTTTKCEKKHQLRQTEQALCVPAKLTGRVEQEFLNNAPGVAEMQK